MRHCPNCGKPRLDEIPLFCPDGCEEDYKGWLKSSSPPGGYGRENEPRTEKGDS